MDKQSNKSKLVLKSLFNNFYNKEENKIIVANIINRKASYSRRILEWFCSNYSKRKGTVIKLKSGKNFDVYKSYKLQLDAYQKKQFDPFKRDREGYSPFELEYTQNGEEKKIKTTVGQLNFFKWCIDNEIIDYIEKNTQIIKEDMKNCSKNKEEYKKEKDKKIVVSRIEMKKFDGVKLVFR